MRALLTAPALALLVAAPAHADPVRHTPPFVDHTEWVHLDAAPSLRVYPTPAGRAAAGDSDGDEAWAEVLALAPDADTPGMREQFGCHWQWAEFAQPGKTSWNLEPWRPVVDDTTMLNSGCNPGGAEE